MAESRTLEERLELLEIQIRYIGLVDSLMSTPRTEGCTNGCTGACPDPTGDCTYGCTNGCTMGCTGTCTAQTATARGDPPPNVEEPAPAAPAARAARSARGRQAGQARD